MAGRIMKGEPQSAGMGGDDDGEPLKSKKSKPGPRKRVSQACDKCRSRKDKCDGKKPACSTCLKNGRLCSYEANVKKRGLPEGYVRGLEKLWGLAIRDIDDVEESMIESLNGGDEGKESSLPSWNDETNSENLVKLWRKSQLSQELEKLLSSNPEPIVEGSKRKRLDSDPQAKRPTLGSLESGPDLKATSSMWMGNQPGSRLNQFVEYSDLPGLGERTAFEAKETSSILSPTYLQNDGRDTGASQILPELPSETWNLLDVYFSYTHSWLPIIEKHDLLRTSYQYSQSSPDSGTGDHAALWAAIAYAKFQHRAINNTPRAQGSVREFVWTAERMYSHARSLVPNEEGVLELGHIQALLILTVANMGMGHLRRAWSLIGKAVRAAIDLELDKSSDPSFNPFKPKSRAKHIFLGCFVLDTIIAARLGRRPHLRADDASEIGPIEEEGLEEWDPWADCLSVRRGNSAVGRVPSSILSTFNQLVEVLKILSEAICKSQRVYSLPLSTSLIEKLHLWSQSQSPPLYLESSSAYSEQTSSLLPHQFHLHTTYFTTLIVSQMLANHDGQESINLEPCTRTARQISDLLKQHSNTFGLLIVPPTYEYYVKSAYDVVNEVRGSIDNTHIVLNDWKHNLDSCLDAMEPAWAAFDSLKDTVSHSAQGRRRESEVAFELISGINQDQAGTPMSAKTRHGFETSGPYSPHRFSGQGSSQRPRTMSHTMGVLSPSSHRSQSFGRSTGHGLPQPPSMYQNAHATLVNRGEPMGMPVQTPAIMNSGQHPARQSRQSFASVDSPLDHQFASNRSTISDNDTDPLANEFAALDAMEWTGNWDQSLANLGFTDRDKMNQDFYAFCQEPDPLHPNNVFQQLVANSNAEVTNFFDAGLNGMAMSVGAFGMGLGDENEGIEAGQILQSLSAAEDQTGGIVL